MLDYIRDAGEIYRQSFATIRAEADLSRFPDDVARVVVRLIHTCGLVEVTDHVSYTDDVVTRAHAALAAGAAMHHDLRLDGTRTSPGGDARIRHSPRLRRSASSGPGRGCLSRSATQTCDCSAIAGGSRGNASRQGPTFA